MVKDIIVIYRKKWNYFGFSQFGNVIFRILNLSILLNFKDTLQF